MKTELHSKFRRQLTEVDFERSRIPKRFWDAQYSIIQGAAPNVLEVYSIYLKNINKFINNGKGLLFWGDNGSGKTSAGIVIMKEAIRRGYTTLFLTAKDLMYEEFNKNIFEEGVTIRKRAETVDLLLLDDLGKELHGKDPSFYVNTIEEFLRVRVANLKSLLITTNIVISNLKDIYNKSLVEVLKGSVASLKFDSFDYRNIEKDEYAKFLTRG